MKVTVTFWNQWVRPRFERTADGTAAVYFGVGRVTWQRKVRRPRDKFGATVMDAGGGIVNLLVDRDTTHYPEDGAHVHVIVE